MPFFKIADIRVRFDRTGDYMLRVDGLGKSDTVDRDAPTVRVAAMAEVFNSGRDCWWQFPDPAFTTNPVPETQGESTMTEGIVTAWDIRIPARVAPITIELALLDERTAKPTSGNAATGVVKMEVAEADLPIVLALLQSPYCYYAGGSLRNSDYDVA